MNKLLIILLAVCLINVHAFVKRDAEPANSPNVMDNISKQMQDLKAVMEKQFDPEQIKTEFNSLLDNVTKLVNSMKSNPEAPK